MMFAFFVHVRWWHEESMQFIYHLQSTKLMLSSKYIITAATNNKSPNWILVWYHFSSPPQRKTNLFPRAKHTHTYISQNSSGRRKGKDGMETQRKRDTERGPKKRERDPIHRLQKAMTMQRRSRKRDPFLFPATAHQLMDWWRGGWRRLQSNPRRLPAPPRPVRPVLFSASASVWA